MVRAVGLAVVLGTLAGCEQDPNPRATAAAPVDSAPAARARNSLPAPLARARPALPDSLRRTSGACPFECCGYGTWTPAVAVPLRAAPRRDLPIVHRIAAREPFSADSGFVEITGTALVVVREPVRTYADFESPGVLLEPGDTLVVLDYVGEGYYNLWDGERVLLTAEFWGPDVTRPRGALLDGTSYLREWWVHATTRTGTRGWIDADSVPIMEGADACAQ